MIASKDVAGTKWDANRGNFDATNIPHIHAALILPFWVTDADTEIAFMHSLKRVVQKVDGIKSCNIGASSGSVLVERFTPNKPLWWLVDYNTKARRFSKASDEFEPLVFPYHLRLEKYEVSKARTDFERERFHRKRNNILAGQLRAYRNLTYNPKLFYKSEMCCDFSTSHKALLASNVLMETEDYTPSEQELNRIVEWRGKFDNSNFGTAVALSTANTSPPRPVLVAQKPPSWGVSLDGYVDESACRVAVGKSVLPPTAQQLQVMPPDFGHYPSEHAWLNSQDCFHQRLGFWRLYFAIRPLARFQGIYR
ncbi:hypothetical protein [Phaeobacter sp. SYSU ZJ3003]|uniref:hypothetical protein n=1 Tax=Phaeobacter sp. SYSU ZJ3003 TaxID=2109330 RepID=UPI00351C8DDD